MTDDTFRRDRERLAKLLSLTVAGIANPCFAKYECPADPWDKVGRIIHYTCHREHGHDGNHFGEGITMEWSDEESTP
jgi:hypothetical protein